MVRQTLLIDSTCTSMGHCKVHAFWFYSRLCGYAKMKVCHSFLLCTGWISVQASRRNSLYVEINMRLYLQLKCELIMQLVCVAGMGYHYDDHGIGNCHLEHMYYCTQCEWSNYIVSVFMAISVLFLSTQIVARYHSISLCDEIPTRPRPHISLCNEISTTIIKIHVSSCEFW